MREAPIFDIFLIIYTVQYMFKLTDFVDMTSTFVLDLQHRCRCQRRRWPMLCRNRAEQQQQQLPGNQQKRF